MKTIKQRTLASPLVIEGIGLHSGLPVSLTLLPQPANSGIRFVRTDLDRQLEIPVSAFNISETMMSTNLSNAGVSVATIEHLMSVLAGFGIDNLRVELSALEVPIVDGSAWPFAQGILRTGIRELPVARKFLQVLQPVEVNGEDKWARIKPFNGFRMSFEIRFNHPVFKSFPQHATFHLSAANYYHQLAHARTFGFMQDIDRLRQNNLALGGSLDNAVVIGEHAILNPEGLRRPAELVHHKILDALGDLYVCSYAILGEYEAYRSGHELNNALLRKLLNQPESFRIIELEDEWIDYTLPAEAPSYVPEKLM